MGVLLLSEFRSAGRVVVLVAWALSASGVDGQVAPKEQAVEMFKRGFDAYTAQDFAEAERLFSTGLKDQPADGLAWYYLALTRKQLKKDAMVAPALDEAARLGVDPRLIEKARPAPDRLALAQSKNCLACHAIDRKVLGPSFRDVSTRYRGNPSALDQLARNIAQGSNDVWGHIPMPPNPQVSNADAVELARWILETN